MHRWIPERGRLAALGTLSGVVILAGCQTQTAATPKPTPTVAQSGAQTAASPAANSPATQLKDLTRYLDEAVVSLQKNDPAGARKQYAEFDQGWAKVEDGVKVKSVDIYRTIEDAMGEVKGTLVTPATPDNAKATDALKKLDKTIEDALPSLR